MRYRVRLSFDGAAFNGWQAQTNAKSVQECLQKALSALLGEDIEVTGAGRTDSKVNAINYVAHFDTAAGACLETGDVCYKLNAILPTGIAVHEVSEASQDFHARFSATQREYAYFVHRRKDPFIERHSYLYTYDLDIGKMNDGASLLLGRHDFSCFEKKGGGNKTSLCDVTAASWASYSPDHILMLGYPAEKDSFLIFRISSDRFLRNMVRAIVGSLLEIGRGRKEPGWISELINGGNRSDAGESVPGKALFLNKIQY